MADDWKTRSVGYTVDRQLGPGGDLLSETHCYGILEIGLVTKFFGGNKTGEMYFLRGKPTTRLKYEAARTKFPEMPPADGSLEDPLVELRRVQAEERRHSTKRSGKHKADPEVARKHDTICAGILTEEDCEDVAFWMKKSISTLGEMTRRASRELVRKLMGNGAVRIIACKIDRAVDRENSGELVVVLPQEPRLRKSIFKIAANWAIKSGFEPTPDDGQTMVYIKLD